ncbi:alanine:cation symporter family protein [Rhodococcus sp. HNM0563]|uniref:alanine/glycine:cation symporter family protein n=1 Tax=unclassified Rhodococcus (in: high G+C Gram-positive bacteria) TaxID=192944 RepID=UPI00146A689C|nr:MULTISPECIES: sodium:alanine symporter family protein [unclassified Rhodococcus (in: high G+C Gram-positive bacteria)]MCK0089644.1 alanine:cation symporter family protein [Rhodococcus sp. F64268]NLU62419.1 alanine:cation symporter family protein [Rhodococcus sp. HNM0563]
MDAVNDFLVEVAGVVWGPYLLIPLLLGTGLLLTIRLRGVQFRKLGPALKLGLITRNDPGAAEGDISQYQALTTALAATVGVGNIAGVATAIYLGGPGALFWMWVTGLLGMASKYSEAFLGVKYRTRDAKGEQSGGPQYYLARAIPNRFGLVLSLVFAVFAVLASFGIGNMTQANTVATQMDGTFGVPTWVSGAVMTVLAAAVLLGGIKSIGRVTAGFVPAMIVLYVGAGILVLAVNFGEIPAALGLVFSDAFTGTAATGGFIGSVFMAAMRYGVARGIFSNESGMGSAAIAAAAARTTHPVRQGLVSMTQTFIDTIIVVTFTGMVIITTGAWQSGEEGAAMTSTAFADGLGGDWGHWIVAISVVFFAFSTILGWSYYGERCVERLVGRGGVVPYRAIFVVVVFIGATTELQVVWNFSDVMNGLMALPNLIGLILLSGMIARETKAYLDRDPYLLGEPPAREPDNA